MARSNGNERHALLMLAHRSETSGGGISLHYARINSLVCPREGREGERGTLMNLSPNKQGLFELSLHR